jgi:hypothetical protein
MNVIRIPTKFSKSISRLSDKNRLEVFDYLLKIWWDQIISVPDNEVWDIVTLIYWEWMNMESRNWTKPTFSHISEWVGTISPSESEHRIEYSILEDNIIKENIIEISSKEDTEKSVVIKKEYWDPIINSIIQIIKDKNNGIIDWTIASNRKYGKMLRDKIDKIKWFKWDYPWFIWMLIDKTDQYNIWKTTSCESIYYNLASLVAKIKTTHIETKEKEEEAKPKTWRLQPTTSLITT